MPLVASANQVMMRVKREVDETGSRKRPAEANQLMIMSGGTRKRLRELGSKRNIGMQVRPSNRFVAFGAETELHRRD